MTASVSRQADSVPTSAVEDFAHRRLTLVRSDHQAGPADLAVALRGQLRAESERVGFLTGQVPAGAIPPKIFLERAGIEQINAGLRARPWIPTWLSDVSRAGVDESWLPRERRPIETVSGDPMLRQLKLRDFTSDAQRVALRATICGQRGDTILVCLPTGAGKSLCAFLPGLLPLDSESGLLGVTLVVVPTVALALDQEARLAQRVGHPIAYRPERKEEAEAIRQRCEAGVQGPVIVSPEALSGAMLKVLRQAARAGHFRNFVIDEAHIVLSWGDEFRPAFLRLASIRRDLAQRTPQQAGFVTVLLSATFTDYHLRWLRTLLSEEGRFSIVHAARLRPEPTYWIARAKNGTERDQWIEEAIFHLPRPCIVYTTQRSECRRWYQRFRDLGFSRVGVMTGESSDEDRRKLLHGWCEDKIDVMVATSAFGLGIDKPNVRAVVHAELPESVDRFYQDVGRAGRDGHSAISLLVTSPADWRTAQRISRPKFITGQLGLARWKRLHQTLKPVVHGSDVYLVDLSVGRDLDMHGDYNRNWNLRTLQLLARTGAIEFVGHDSETFNLVAIRLLPVRSLTQSYWESRVEVMRAELIADYVRSGRLLARLGQPMDDCLSGLFVECYSSETFGVPAVVACGGCPGCRARQMRPRCGRLLARRIPARPAPSLPLGGELAHWLAGQPGALILLPAEAGADADLDILTWCAGQGITTFVVPEAKRSLLDQVATALPGAILFSVERLPRTGDLLAHQSACVWLGQQPPVGWAQRFEQLRSAVAPTIVIASPDEYAPGDRKRKLLDVFPGPVITARAWVNRFVA